MMHAVSQVVIDAGVVRKLGPRPVPAVGLPCRDAGDAGRLALQAVDAGDGPGPGLHTGYRGGPLLWYDAETRESIDALADPVPGSGPASLRTPTAGHGVAGGRCGRH